MLCDQEYRRANKQQTHDAVEPVPRSWAAQSIRDDRSCADPDSETQAQGGSDDCYQCEQAFRSTGAMRSRREHQYPSLRIQELERHHSGK